MKSKFLYVLVKALIIVGMLIGLGLAVYLVVEIYPAMLAFFPLENKPTFYAILGVALGLLCVAGAEYIAITLFGMMCTLQKDPFVTANVRALRRMGWMALIIVALGLSTMLLHPLPLAVVAAFPLSMCGLFSLVLSGVFERAVAFKLENDLTV
jgi:hypothetical protein